MKTNFPLVSAAHVNVVLAFLSISFTVAAQTQVSGTVESGGAPVIRAKVTLYVAGGAKHAQPKLVGTAFSDANGAFQIALGRGNRALTLGDIPYVISVGGSLDGVPKKAFGRSPIALATVIGSWDRTAQGVVINERTTVATAWAMAQFITGLSISGKNPGLQNAADTVRNLVNISTGDVGSVLANPPNGLQTSTLAEFNSLANLLSVCVSEPDGAPCANLLALATPPGERAAANTLEAALDIAHNPTHNIAGLFQLSQSSNEYTPALTSTPNAWVLAIKYVGNGNEFDGPGNMAIDRHGNLWITNNYDGALLACGGKQILELTPAGQDAPGAPFSGGGLDGAGFGISIDPTGHIWIGNFGFAGSHCNNLPAADSVSEFDSDGVPLSPPDGYTGAGAIHGPQGTQSDFDGNIWVANYGTLDNTSPGTTVTEFVNGDPNEVKTFSNFDLKNPFDIAVGPDGSLWVTSRSNNKVVHFAQDGSIIATYTGSDFSAPLAIAIDSLGNAWVTDQTGASITEIDTRGAAHVFQGGGLHGPWGIAVDGNDNVWVANFVGEAFPSVHLLDGSFAVSEFCGARVENCPQGLKTGDPISPSTGFTSEALQRLTGIVIDPSGNVWVADNWKRIPVQTNPGGDGLVEFIGIAGPVAAPRIGPPHKP